MRSIPMMTVLSSLFPASQLVITGVLSPGSNAHGPDEMFVIDYAKGVCGCVSLILEDHSVAAAANESK